MSTPLVSILVVTHNHERFISQCLSSLNTQNCDFDYEIVVCNDASSDSTGDICEKIKASMPRVKYFVHTKNVGVSINFAFGLSKCRGKYIAFCDGDDYWTNDSKLKLMVETLVSNPNAGLVYSDSGRLDDATGKLEPRTLKPQPTPFTMAHLPDVIGPAVNSMMVRKSIFPAKFPKAFHQVVNPDIFMHIWALDSGNGIYINEPMSVYRIHSGGVWSPIPQPEKSMIHWSSRITALASFGSKYQDLQEECMDRLTPMLETCLRQGKVELFKKYFPYLSLKRKADFKLKRLYYRLFVKD